MKAKVVAAAWGRNLFNSLPHSPALLFLHQDDLKKIMNRIKATWRNGCFKIWLFHNTPNHHPGTRIKNPLIDFLCELLVFCEKISEWVIRSKNEQFAHLLIFGERPEQIAHCRSFLEGNLSDSLTSLILGKRPEWFFHISHQNKTNLTYIKHTKK